jgi:hypothetical protein
VVEIDRLDIYIFSVKHNDWLEICIPSETKNTKTENMIKYKKNPSPVFFFMFCMYVQGDRNPSLNRTLVNDYLLLSFRLPALLPREEVRHN